MNRKEATKKALEIAGVPKDRIILMTKFSPLPYAKKLVENTKFLHDKHRRFWRFDNEQGIWREDAENYIKKILRDQLLGDEQQRSTYVSEIVQYIKDKSYSPDFELELQDHLIPFQNVIYDMNKEEFVDFDPSLFITNKIPIEIDSKHTECPIIDAFFEDIVGKEHSQILYDLASYCLYRAQPYQKLFFLIGGGKNGKTTYLELIRALLGEENVSSVSPHEICGTNRFALGSMWNKYANISSDISYEILKNVNRIKEITGGDTVHIERKYKEGFPSRIYAKQIFSTNQLPIITDKTLAWYRRVYLIHFLKEFNEKEIDREMLKKLTKKEELMGFAWNCVKNLKELKKRDFVFNLDIDVEKLEELYDDLSNPLSKFLKENTVEDPNGSIFKYEFKQIFLEWLKTHRFRMWSDTELGINMKQKFEDGKKVKDAFDNETKKFVPKQYRAWLGLTWKTENIHTSHTIHPLTNSSIYIERGYKPPPSLPTLSSLHEIAKKSKKFEDLGDKTEK